MEQGPTLDGLVGRRENMNVMNKCDGSPVTLTQNGQTMRGHWHDDIAIFSDGHAFKAGRGWFTWTESKRLAARLCSLGA